MHAMGKERTLSSNQGWSCASEKVSPDFCLFFIPTMFNDSPQAMMQVRTSCTRDFLVWEGFLRKIVQEQAQLSAPLRRWSRTGPEV